MSASDGSALVPLLEVAQRLGLSANTVYRHKDAGDFPLAFVRIGARWYVRRADLEAYLAAAGDLRRAG